MGRRAGRRNSRGPLLAQREAARQDLGKPDECQKRRQANDRNHNATEHGSQPFYAVPAYTKRISSPRGKRIFPIKLNILGYQRTNRQYATTNASLRGINEPPTVGGMCSRVGRTRAAAMMAILSRGLAPGEAES
jgi:hypothetical protein